MALTAKSTRYEEKPGRWRGWLQGLQKDAEGQWRGAAGAHCAPVPLLAALPRGMRNCGAGGGQAGGGRVTARIWRYNFFFLLFQVNTLPRPPLSPSTPPPSLSVPLMCFYLRAAVQTNMIGIYSPLLTFSSSL